MTFNRPFIKYLDAQNTFKNILLELDLFTKLKITNLVKLNPATLKK